MKWAVGNECRATVQVQFWFWFLVLVLFSRKKKEMYILYFRIFFFQDFQRKTPDPNGRVKREIILVRGNKGIDFFPQNLKSGHRLHRDRSKGNTNPNGRVKREKSGVKSHEMKAKSTRPFGLVIAKIYSQQQ